MPTYAVVAESNTSNNTSAPAPIAVSLELQSSVQQGAGQTGTGQSGTTQIAQVAGLQVVSVASSATAAPGANPTVSWTVVNNGPGTTDSNYWDDDVWISTNNTLGSGGTDIYLDTVEHINLRSRRSASYSASATIAVPLTVPAGSYFFHRYHRSAAPAACRPRSRNQQSRGQSRLWRHSRQRTNGRFGAHAGAQSPGRRI